MVAAIVGSSIPPNTPHVSCFHSLYLKFPLVTQIPHQAVSVSLPTWKANVGYEEGQEWVISKMKTGYPRFVPLSQWHPHLLPRSYPTLPRFLEGCLNSDTYPINSRFFIHKSIEKLAQSILQKHGQPGEEAMLFPSARVAARCRQFIKQRSESSPPPSVRVVEFACKTPKTPSVWSDLCAVLFPAEEFKVAKQFWQHTGDGISSRRAEFCQGEFEEGVLVEKGTVTDDLSALSSPPLRVAKGPKRYSPLSKDKIDYKPQAQNVEAGEDCSRFVEERFGRILDASFIDYAKLAIRRRIAGTLKSNVELKDALELSSEGGRLEEGFSEGDVYLHPTGMSAIYNTHRLLMSALGPKKSVCYG